jgi:hypothetical protein
MGWAAPHDGSPARRAEADAHREALRVVAYKGPVDDDGHPLRGPGSYARVFSAGEGVPRDARRDEHLAAEAWAWARFDGGFDNDGEADDDWITEWTHRRRGRGARG